MRKMPVIGKLPVIYMAYNSDIINFLLIGIDNSLSISMSKWKTLEAVSFA